MSGKWGLFTGVSLVFVVLGAVSPGLLSAGPVGPFVADFADTVEPGKLSLQMIPVLGLNQGEFDQDGKIRYLPSGDRDASLSLSLLPIYGIAQDLEISGEVPIIYNWKSQSGRSAQDGGVGDTSLKMKYRLYEGGTDSWAPSISTMGKVRFPTGRYDNLSSDKLGTDATGSGAFLFTLGVNVGKCTNRWQVTANLWYNWPLETTVDGVRTKEGNFWFYALTGEYALSKHWSVLLEFYGQEQGKREINGGAVGQSESRVLNVLPGIGWDISEKMYMMAGCSFPLLGKNSSLTVTPSLFFNYNF
jgi:hypothetical protein